MCFAQRSEWGNCLLYRNTLVRLLALFTPTLRATMHSVIQTDRRRHDANSWSYCVWSAKQILFYYNNTAGASCTADELSMNSKCYRKFHSSLTWYNASNDCLSRGGSLAVFTDIERPSDNRQLIDWLTTSGTYRTYWIGLIQSWWKTTSEGGFELLRKQCAVYVNV